LLRLILLLCIHAKHLDQFKKIAVAVLPVHSGVKCAVRKITVKVGAFTSRLSANAAAGWALSDFFHGFTSRAASTDLPC
jgi:hypothetical protein